MYKNNLKKIMSEKDVSGLELFRRTNISPGIISVIANNRMLAYPGWRKRIADALDVSEREVFPEESEGDIS